MINEPILLKPKLLLVDDREDNLLSIEAILRQDSYEFATATSGSQALKILAGEPDFAMILMDVKMPVLSGFETATLIYEQEALKHIPIIFITANYYGEENLFKGYQAGGIDYIFKPINPEVLRAKVSIFIELYRKNRMLIEQDLRLMKVNRNLTLEIRNLKASRLKLKAANQILLKKIADLESLMSVFNIPIEQSEFVDSDLNQLVHGLLKDMQEDVKSATISVENLPSLCVSPRLMRPLFKNLIRNTLFHQQKNVSPVIRIHSEMRDSIIDGSRRRQKYCNIFVEDQYDELPPGPGREISAEPYDTESGLGFCQKIMEHHRGHILKKT
ncbi:MAG TPA: response regulator, partial [Chryseosolibacter sp.]